MGSLLGLRQPLNAVNVSLRRLRAPRRLAKALYARMIAVDSCDCELAQARLNRVLATTDFTGSNARITTVENRWGPDPMGAWHGRNE